MRDWQIWNVQNTWHTCYGKITWVKLIYPYYFKRHQFPYIYIDNHMKLDWYLVKKLFYKVIFWLKETHNSKKPLLSIYDAKYNPKRLILKMVSHVFLQSKVKEKSFKLFHSCVKMFLQIFLFKETLIEITSAIMDKRQKKSFFSPALNSFNTFNFRSFYH